MQPLNWNPRVVRNVLARYLLVWVADAVSVAATAAVVPKIYFRQDLPVWYLSPFIVALLLGLLNALVRPILLLLFLPITFMTLGLATLALNAVLFYIAHLLVGPFVVETFTAAVAGVLVLTLVNTFLGNVLRLSDDYSFYAAVTDRLSTLTRGRSLETGERGLVILQIDGLSLPTLKRALRKGRMPFVKDLIKRKRYALKGWFSGLPSQTSSVQASLFYGSSYDIPGFRWYDKEKGRLVVSSNSGDMQAVDERFASYPQPLLKDGTCINSLIHGGASKRILTLSALGGKDIKTRRAELEDFAIFCVHPYLYTRTILWMLGDFIVDRVEALGDLLRRRKDRIPRSIKFSFLRSVANAAFRESATYFVTKDVVRGVPVIYANYVGYDMVAHHTGPLSKDALGVLSRIDRQVKKISRAISRKAPRPYDLVILSDHGQTESVPFRTLYGRSLSELVGETLQRPGAERPGPSVEMGYFDTLLREMRRADQAYKKRSLSRSRKTLELLGEKISEGHAEEKPDDAFVVCASGNLAHIYLKHAPGRLSAEYLFEKHSNLLEVLVGHPGIGFVLMVGETGGTMVISRSGMRALETGETEGEDPLRPYLDGKKDDHVLRALRTLAAFPHSGDVVVNGAMLRPDVTVSFEDQVSTHGGLGGPQTTPFVIFPGRLRKRRQGVQSAAEIHAFLGGALSGSKSV